MDAVIVLRIVVGVVVVNIVVIVVDDPVVVVVVQGRFLRGRSSPGLIERWEIEGEILQRRIGRLEAYSCSFGIPYCFFASSLRLDSSPDSAPGGAKFSAVWRRT